MSNRFSPHEAFAAILGDGSVITWRHRGHGIPSEAQDQLRNVQQIQCTDYAFSAIRADGSALTWGNLSSCRFGGFQVQALRPRQRVEDKRKRADHHRRARTVCQIQATRAAFIAILADESVVTWGDRDFGGDNSAV